MHKNPPFPSKTLNDTHDIMTFMTHCTDTVSFPDVVDSRFPELVDNLLETLTPLLKRFSFIKLCINLWQIIISLKYNYYFCRLIKQKFMQTKWNQFVYLLCEAKKKKL